MRHLGEIEQMAEETGTVRELIDFSECEGVALSGDQLRMVVVAGNRPLTKFARYRLAIHAEKDVHYGLSRMFETYHEHADYEIELQVFRDRASALEWLTED